jgi:hypothetical protein
MTWKEIKKAVEEAGVEEDEETSRPKSRESRLKVVRCNR